MKKAFSLALVLTLLLSAVCVFPASALHRINCGDFWITPITETTAEIGCADFDLSGQITIPEALDSYSVTEIARYGFSNTQITEVTIPSTVTKINEYAFTNCESLEKIIIPASVTHIGDCAIGYKDNYVDNDGEMLPDGGYVRSSSVIIYGYADSEAEAYAKENLISFVEIKDEKEVYKNKVLELLHISEQDPETGEGYLAYYKEGYEYFSPQSESKDIPTFVLIKVYENVSGPAFAAEVFGDYILRSSSHLYPTTFGYYVYYPEKNEIYPLPNAYKMEFEGIENVFTLGGVGELIGDVNYDRELNIRDATLIQKSLAGLAKIERNVIEASDYWLEGKGPAYIGDFNRDREMNIRDATAIQKKIAGL